MTEHHEGVKRCCGRVLKISLGGSMFLFVILTSAERKSAYMNFALVKNGVSQMVGCAPKVGYIIIYCTSRSSSGLCKTFRLCSMDESQAANGR